MSVQDRHPDTQHVMRGFAYAHLRPPLRDLSQSFHDLAHDVLLALPDGPELTVALRKLLEAKDAAVRHLVYHLEDESEKTVQALRDEATRQVIEAHGDFSIEET